jgi:hypothetical protein
MVRARAGEHVLFSVCNSISNHTFQKCLQNTTSLLIDHGGNTLDTSTTSKTSDSGLCDTLDIVTKNLAVTFGSALSETLATFSTCEDALARCDMLSVAAKAEDGE